MGDIYYRPVWGVLDTNSFISRTNVVVNKVKSLQEWPIQNTIEPTRIARHNISYDQYKDHWYRFLKYQNSLNSYFYFIGIGNEIMFVLEWFEDWFSIFGISMFHAPSRFHHMIESKFYLWMLENDGT